MKAILELLGERKLDVAFQLLKNAYQANPKKWKDALILLSRYQKISDDSVKGILSYTDQTIVENNLINDTLKYLQQLESGEESVPEPSLHVVGEIVNENSLEQAIEDFRGLQRDFPGSTLVDLAQSALDIRKGLNTVSRDTVDNGFDRLHKILRTNNTEYYKTAFCLMLVYKIEFYESWNIPLPTHFDFTYNTYIGASLLLRDFLVKLKLSPQAKNEIRNVYKNL